MDRAIEGVTNGCHTCVALLNAPRTVIQQSTNDPPDTIGASFAANILKRECQLVLVLRECVTSYTATCFVDNECHTTLITLCLGW